MLTAEEISKTLSGMVTAIGVAASRVNVISNKLHDFDLSKPLNISYHELSDVKMELYKLEAQLANVCPECLGDKNYKVLPSQQDPHRLTSPTYCPTCQGE